MHEWTRGDAGYLSRVDHLRCATSGGLNGSVLINDASVFDDGCADVLTGSAGQDWFLFNQDGDSGVADKATDLGGSEFADDLDFING